ncbi:MAG: hypothetical protein EOL89_01240 [Actinobacteria bacterium]|nr:hypothetical protein [Actinomycetota bacterium]
MTTYLAVSAVRIQSWLIRTPKLRLMRGASAALSAETSTSTVTRFLASQGWSGTVTVVDDAGDVDGVVALTVAPQVSPDVVAHRLLRELSSGLPGVDWEAWWTDARSYTEAYGKFQDDAVIRLVRPAAPLEATLARTCPECRAEPAAAGGGLGADCAAREAAATARERTGTQRDTAAPRGNDACPPPGRPPRDFDELARIGGLPAVSSAVGRRESSNHLATVVADGNRVGDIFSQLRDLKNDTVNGMAVDALSTATRTAVCRALTLIAPSSAVQAGIVHFVGGDDVFVSVPAREAWRFAAYLGREFDHEMRGALREIAEEAKLGEESRSTLERLPTPSLGIGLVFADSRHPIADTHALATAALKQAKRATRGLTGAVVWADLTTEPHPPRDRVARLTDLLEDLDPDGSRGAEATARLDVMRMPPSARTSLASVLASAWGPNGEGAVTAAALAAQWARRTGRTLVPGLESKDPAVAAEAATLTRDLLSRARWWPVPQTGGPET